MRIPKALSSSLNDEFFSYKSGRYTTTGLHGNGNAGCIPYASLLRHIYANPATCQKIPTYEDFIAELREDSPVGGMPDVSGGELRWRVIQRS